MPTILPFPGNGENGNYPEFTHSSYLIFIDGVTLSVVRGYHYPEYTVLPKKMTHERKNREKKKRFRFARLRTMNDRPRQNRDIFFFPFAASSQKSA